MESMIRLNADDEHPFKLITDNRTNTSCNLTTVKPENIFSIKCPRNIKCPYCDPIKTSITASPGLPG